MNKPSDKSPNDVWDLVSIGETMALMREERQAKKESCFRLGFGGAESNVLTQVSRLGLRARWFSSLGQDSFGELVRLGLASQNVDTVLHDANSRPTGFMVKTYGDRIDPEVEYFRSNSAASQIRPTDLNLDDLFRTRMLHMTGIFPALSPEASQSSMRVFEEARGREVPISFDVNYRKKLWDESDASKYMRQIWRHSTYLFGDREELSLLFEGTPPDSDEALLAELSEQSRVVVLKKGSTGAAAIAAGDYISVPAAPADVVDTVGAGDAFVGGFLTGMLFSLEVRAALSLATICGAAACESRGDWEGQIGVSQLTNEMKGLLR